MFNTLLFQLEFSDLSRLGSLLENLSQNVHQMESRSELIRQYISRTREETDKVRAILKYLEQAQQEAVLKIIDQTSTNSGIQVIQS